MDSDTRCKRDVLSISLPVGLILAAETYFPTKLFDKGKRISYTLDGPTAYVNPQAIGKLKITVARVEIPIMSYEIQKTKI